MINLKETSHELRTKLARKSEPFFLAYKKNDALTSPRKVIHTLLGKKLSNKLDSEIWTLISATSQTIRYDSDTCQISLDRSNYTTANQITKKNICLNRMTELLTLLESKSLITLYKGFYLKDSNKRGVDASMRSLIQFSTEWFAMFDVMVCSTHGTARDFELVILKDRNGKVISHKGMRGIGQEKALLKEWNTLLYSTVITIDGDTVKPTYTTVFNEGSLELGGRLYAGAFSTEHAELRPTITINNNPTCEVDYKNNHIRILYNEYGIDYQEDAYTLPLFEGMDEKEQRLAAKFAMLIMLNAKSRRQANGALEAKLTSLELNSSKIFVKHLFDELKKKHTIISDHFFCSEWARLQNIDSKMAKHVVKAFTVLGVPILTYHDSFVCESHHKSFLIKMMKEAWEIVLGDAKGFGYDVEFDNGDDSAAIIEGVPAGEEHTKELPPVEAYESLSKREEYNIDTFTLSIGQDLPTLHTQAPDVEDDQTWMDFIDGKIGLPF